MEYRIRSKLLDGNLPLIVLRLLRNVSMDKWEILDSIYHSFGISPDERELERLIKSFNDRGYLQITGNGKRARLRIQTSGVRLLSRLEQEYRAILSQNG
jgi:hypothetical protein